MLSIRMHEFNWVKVILRVPSEIGSCQTLGYFAIIVTIRNNVEIEYTIWLYGSVHAIFGQFKWFFVLADKFHRDVLMIELMNHIGNIAGPGSYKSPTSKPVERNDSNVKRNIAKTSSKYILDNNNIVFERYDRNGKLISRVPWTANRVSAKA